MTRRDPTFDVRTANSAGDDVDFILAAWDSTLPFLASVGAGEMWGQQPFSQREGQRQEVVDIIRQSEEAGPDNSKYYLVAEARRADEEPVKVGAALVRHTWPKYLAEHADLKNVLSTADPLVYIEVLIADHRAGRRAKGVGRALVDALRGRARDRGVDAVYVDAWAMNDRKLNGYYEGLGFAKVSDFELKRGNGGLWLGTLYRIDSDAVS